jgi:hypothetical protein
LRPDKETAEPMTGRSVLFFPFPDVEKQRQLIGNTDRTETGTIIKTELFSATSRHETLPGKQGRKEQERTERRAGSAATEQSNAQAICRTSET